MQWNGKSGMSFQITSPNSFSLNGQSATLKDASGSYKTKISSSVGGMTQETLSTITFTSSSAATIEIRNSVTGAGNDGVGVYSATATKNASGS